MSALVKPNPGPSALQRTVAADLVVGLGLVVAVAAMASGPLDLPALVVLQSAGVFGLAALAVLAGLPRALPHQGFGTANRITLLRVGVTALLAGLIGQPVGHLAWGLVGLGLLNLALDGLDGRVARRTGSCSRFGARFDMEVDALFVLILAALVTGLGKAGPWVLLAGALRYLFVGAQLLVPALDRPLPASRRRQVVCGLQVLALIVCLAPPVSGLLSAGIAAAALTILGLSFATDLAWLIRRARNPGDPS